MAVAGPTAAALVIFADPDAADPSLRARLSAFYTLTRAEAEIAARLGAGRSPAEIAAERDARPSTVRAQIKSVMAKMEVRRQAEIAAAVAALPPLPASPG